MANYYTDQPEIAFHLEHPLMKRIVELKERNYADKDKYDEAPVNYEDAIENYKRILDITGRCGCKYHRTKLGIGGFRRSASHR